MVGANQNEMAEKTLLYERSLSTSVSVSQATEEFVPHWVSVTYLEEYKKKKKGFIFKKLVSVEQTMNN